MTSECDNQNFKMAQSEPRPEKKPTKKPCGSLAPVLKYILGDWITDGLH